MTLEFPRKFYSAEAVAAARDAYAECARFSVKEEAGNLIVVIDQVAAGLDPETLRDEFGNRVLSEMA